jgi:choline dehydrogenase-like flavoprotein
MYSCKLVSHPSSTLTLTYFWLRQVLTHLIYSATKQQYLFFFKSESEWKARLLLTPQAEMRSSHVSFWAQRKALGGCSSINAMQYVRGKYGDYEHCPADWKHPLVGIRIRNSCVYRMYTRTTDDGYGLNWEFATITVVHHLIPSHLGIHACETHCQHAGRQMYQP